MEFPRLTRWWHWLCEVLKAGVHSLWNRLRDIPGTRLGTVFRWIGIVIASIAGLILLLVLFLIFYPNSQIHPQEPLDEMVYLDQGWGRSLDSKYRQGYYYTPQGTSIFNLRYEWFVHLERAWGEERFANPLHMRAFGFWVDMQPTERNPHQLPVGFAKRFEPSIQENVLDITCAACHTGQLSIVKEGRRTGVRIDGGQAMHAFTATAIGHFGPSMVGALAATYFNPFKFNRFARRVLGDNYSQGKAWLHSALWQVLYDIAQEAYIEKSKHLYPVQEGYGRTDALGRISNRVFARNIDPANYRVGNAPVSYPPVWDIWKFDWVQYSGSVRQPLARNLGESMGVGADYPLLDPYGRPIPERERYRTTTAFDNLVYLENEVLRTLKPPEWPEDVFGKIDWCKAAKGRELFLQHCEGCHGPHVMDEPATKRNSPGKVNEAKTPHEVLPEWQMTMLDVEDIGTDPAAARNFYDVRVSLRKTGMTEAEMRKTLMPALKEDLKRAILYYKEEIALWQKKPQNPETKKQIEQLQQQLSDAETNGNGQIEQQLNQINLDEVSIGAGLSFFGYLMRDLFFKERRYDPATEAVMNGFGALDLPQVVRKYKARPLGGVWATAPYLHNGSVPNLYSMLIPAAQRPTKFFVGRHDFDPVRVGHVLEPQGEGGFWLDATVPGNFNTGHEFRPGYVPYQKGVPQYGVIGPELKEPERWALIEYLKVHNDEEDVIARNAAKVSAASCPAPPKGATR